MGIYYFYANIYKNGTFISENLPAEETVGDGGGGIEAQSYFCVPFVGKLNEGDTITAKVEIGADGGDGVVEAEMSLYYLGKDPQEGLLD